MLLDITKMEEKLANIFDRNYCILVGNGTTAIYLAFMSKGFINKKIALPNNVCMNVVLPIYFSKNIPIFVDIEKETLSLDLDKIKDQKIVSLIAVHNYGNICDINKIQSYCDANNVLLIEDVCVAQGIAFENKILGSFGDISILSFGAGKNLDIGHGGAVLTNNPQIASTIKKILKELPRFDYNKILDIKNIDTRHKEIYNKSFGKNMGDYSPEFKKMCMDYKKSFIYKFDESFIPKLNDGLDNLDKLIALRQKNTNYLKNKLNNVKGLTFLEPKYTSSYWRFNIFVEKYRDDLFKYLLDKRYKVSSWYHSIDLLFEKRLDFDTPVSDWVGENIINIWINEDIDRKYLDEISKDIKKFLKIKYGK